MKEEKIERTETSQIEICENPVIQIVDLIPEIKSLNISTKDPFCTFLDVKMTKLNFKIKTSPYEPCKIRDPLNLNRGFDKAFCKWLSQFPPDKRLGFLVAGLSVAYITHDEFDTLLDIAIQKLDRSFHQREGELESSYFPGFLYSRRQIVPYPISLTSLFDKFIHRAGVERTKDGDVRPSRGVFEDLLYDTFKNLSVLSEEGSNFIYCDRYVDEIMRLIRSWLGSHVILLEDNSFSGTTIKSDIERLVKLIKVLFIPFEKDILRQNQQLPDFYLIIPIATNKAVEQIYQSLGEPNMKIYLNPPLTGYIFDHTYRAVNDLPTSVKELKNILPPKVKVYSKLKDALQFFYDRYFKVYLQETAICQRSNFTPNDWLFGYAKGGWTIVTHSNAPNNALPPIWYPHHESSVSEIKALFPRVESRKSHDRFRSMELNTYIEKVIEDKRGFVKQSVEDAYAKIF